MNGRASGAWSWRSPHGGMGGRSFQRLARSVGGDCSFVDPLSAIGLPDVLRERTWGTVTEVVEA